MTSKLQQTATGRFNGSILVDEDGLPIGNSTNPLVVEAQITGVADGATSTNQLTEIARLEAIRDRLPTTAHSQPLTDAQLRALAISVTDTLNGTRAYNWSAGTRTAFTSTSSTAAITLPALGARREVRVIASARCFVRFGDSAVGVATIAEGQAIFPQDSIEVIVIPVGITHFRVIGETGSGSISFTPVL